MKNSTNIIVVLLLPICFCQQKLSAQWNDDPGINNPVIEMQGGRSHLTLASDGADGAFIFWADSRDWPDLGQIYGQHLDADGIAQWESAGLPVCTAANTQQHSQAVADGQGGVFVVWNDNRSAPGSLQRRQLYAQHYNAAGESSWAPDGMYIGGLINPNGIGVSNLLPGYIRVCTDGAGGMIATWSEADSVLSNVQRAYAQRVDINGNLLWNDGQAMPVHQESSSVGNVSINEDGEGGAYIICRVSQGMTLSLRVHRVDSNGQKLWEQAGIEVAASDVQPQIVSTLAQGNGLFLAWLQSGTNKIMAQLIDHNGQLLWAEGGLAVSVNDYENDDPVVAADALGCYVSYCEKFDSPYCNAYAQRFNYDGTRAWGAQGLSLLNSEVRHHTTGVFADGHGGSVTTITELSMPGVPPQLHAANARSDGQLNGEALLINNTALTQGGSSKAHQVSLPVADHQFITAWSENRAPAPQGQFNIYAAKFGFEPYALSNSRSADSDKELTLYPNPARSHFNLSYTKAQSTLLRVYDLLGKMHHEQRLHSRNTTIETGHWNIGVYLIVVEDGAERYSKRLVIY